MKTNAPICFFDSGIGGSTILKEVIKKLPDENYVYYADSKNNPYGNKTKKELSKIEENRNLIPSRETKLLTTTLVVDNSLFIISVLLVTNPIFEKTKLRTITNIFKITIVSIGPRVSFFVFFLAIYPPNI